MKHWKVTYAVVWYETIVLYNQAIIVEANSIGIAVNVAYKRLNKLFENSPYKFIIYDIGIMEEDIL